MDSDARAIAVFGSSEPQPGDEAYEVARRLGHRLALAGYAVLTGGYGGVMEAASRGAREAGGRAIGVPCRIFGDRSANPYLDEALPAADLFDRMRDLIERATGYVVLPGKAGTLAELSQLWAHERAGCLAARPVVLLGNGWGPLVEFLERSGMLEASQIRSTTVVDSLDRVIEVLGAPDSAGPRGRS